MPKAEIIIIYRQIKICDEKYDNGNSSKTSNEK
jgi:hypothetical protein